MSVITRADIERTQARTLPEALRYLPGVFFSSRDGGGALPMAITRGYFGGGENEYVLLLVDGVPVNSTRTSLIEWTSLPAASIERIEVLRGSGSALYGDVAVGGVINVITRADTTDSERALVGIAHRGEWEASVALTRAFRPGWAAGATADYATGPGYREHAFSRRLSASASVQESPPAERTRVALRYDRLENEDPGPLDEEAYRADPVKANSLFGADERVRDAGELVTTVDRTLGARRMLHAAARVHGARQERTRTLLLTPSFGDTQLHDESDRGAWLRAQHDLLTAASKLVGGVELSGATYESSYRVPETGQETSQASGKRLAAAVYGEWQRELTDRLRGYAGTRYDRVSPSATLNGGKYRKRIQALSARLGMNYAYRNDADAAGNVYLVASRGFKMPSLDQLYDARRTPTGGPDTISISNPLLRPQRADEIEAGIFQRISMGRTSVEVSFAGYLRDLEDEIDFDLATFRYGNIKHTRHEALELLTVAHLWRDVELRNALTVGRAVFRSGPYQGLQLKNLPRYSTQTVASVPLRRGLLLTLAHRTAGKTALDDENTRTIPGVPRFDVGLRLAAGPLEGSIRVENVSDDRNADLGFVLFDPVLSQGVAMLYPGSGRRVRVALKVER